MEKTAELPTPEACASIIFEASGVKFDQDAAADLWQKIMRHKWMLSERLNRDVGFRIACNDFIENIGTDEELVTHHQEELLLQMERGRSAETFGIPLPIPNLPNS